MTDVSLNAKEQSAADAILDAMRAIRALGEGETPYNFTNEVVPAIHTLQMFVLMHWAHRIHPDYWSDWFYADDRNRPPSWIPTPLDLEEMDSMVQPDRKAPPS